MTTYREDSKIINVGPQLIGQYLKLKRWEMQQVINDIAQIWIKPANKSENYEILLPIDHTLTDYSRRISEVFSTLSIVENRSISEIYSDVTNTGSDIIRFRLQETSTSNGSISLSHGVQMVCLAEEVMKAAVNATVRPSAVYQSRYSEEVRNYLDNLQMGQTERGSYVVTVSSPIPPNVNPAFTEMKEFEVKPPFEREVSFTLAKALQALKGYVSNSIQEQSIPTMEEIIQIGISANLCEALTALTLDSNDAELSISFLWSPGWQKIDQSINDNFVFTRESTSIIKEIGRVLKENAVIEDYEAMGFVTKLEQEPHKKTGQITLTTWKDGVLRKITTVLADQYYQLSVEAHSKRLMVSVTGELIKKGKRWLLNNPRKVTILDNGDDEMLDDSEISEADPRQKKI